MAEQLLDRILREIHDRKQAAQAAYDESRQLEQALLALGPATRDSARASERARPQHRTPRRRGRAAPGANREAILALVRERPGVTAGEIAHATGIGRSTVTATLGRLVDGGELKRRKLPSGRAGFRVRETPSAHAAAKPSRGKAEASASKAPLASA